MANRKGALLLLLGLVLSSTSCSYVKNRTNDLLDVFWLDLDVGLWPSVDVQATDYCGIGLGYSDQMLPLVNLHGRHVGRAARRAAGFLAVGAMTGYEDERMSPVLGSGVYDKKHMQPPPNMGIFIPTYVVAGYEPAVRGLRVADFGVGVAAIVGARIGFSPGELLDFVLGIFGVDVGEDDDFGRRTVRSRPRERTDAGSQGR